MDDAYEKYTDLFLSELGKIKPFRLKEAILNHEDIDWMIAPHLEEIQAEAEWITWIPGAMWVIGKATKKKDIKRYLEDVLPRLPEHYAVCMSTPGGMDYLAFQMRKIILVALGSE